MRIGIYGFGSIGRLVARLALKRGMEIVGVVDIDPKLVGRDVGEVLGVERLGVEVSRDPETLVDAEVVIHATSSYLDRVYPQIAKLLEMGLSVVSTCETLAYPYYRYPVLARQLDRLARLRGCTVVGTGINPGFLLDTLVVVLSSCVDDVVRVRAIRSVDPARRREPFRKKVGLGEDYEAFSERLRRGEVTGHVGYAESVALIAYALGIELDKIVEEQRPVKAERRIESHGVVVEEGRCAGIVGYGSGIVGDEEVIRVEFRAVAGSEEFEEIEVVGSEMGRIVWRSSGTHGDLGTASVVLSVAERILEAPPGLQTMVDLLPFKPFTSRRK